MIESQRYAVYIPSKGELHLVDNMSQLPEVSVYQIVLYRVNGVSGSEIRAVVSTIEGVCSAPVKVVQHFEVGADV